MMMMANANGEYDGDEVFRHDNVHNTHWRVIWISRDQY